MLRWPGIFALTLFSFACGDSGDSGEDPDVPAGGPSSPQDPGDPPAVPDGIPGVAESCRAIDITISLDDSGSMKEERDSMRNDVFPAFAQALQQVGNGDVEFRTGVLDACPNPAVFHTRGEGGECNFWGEKPWMLSDSPALANEFACVGDIYSGDNSCTGENDDEQPASSIAAALEGPMADTGFMRQDALLVAVAITDEDEQPTPNMSAAEVYDRLVALKDGRISNIAFLGVGASTDCEGAYGEAREATKLKDITALFEQNGHGLFWDLCGGRLEDGLAEVVTVIDQACDSYCADPDGCVPDAESPDSTCDENNDCRSGELCEYGQCLPILD
jgi:hypothetical protein